MKQNDSNIKTLETTGAAGKSEAATFRDKSGAKADRVLCIGHAFARNYGDRAIYNALKDGLDAHGGLKARAFPIKPIAINHRGHSMSGFRKMVYGVIILPPHYIKLWHSARACKAVLMGSGNPLMDIYPLHSLQFLITCLVVRAAGRRFWIFGGGAGPLKTIIGRACISASCHLAEGVTVRDSASVEALRNCFAMDGILDREVVPDLVLGQEFVRRRLTAGGVFRVGIGAIHYRRPGRSPNADQAAYDAYLDRLERVIRLVVERMCAEVLVFTNEPMEDQDTVDDVMERVRDLPNVRTHNVNSVSSAIRVAGMCDVHVGGRLHSVIFSLVQGIPAIALSSHGKIVGLFADLEAADLVYDIESFDPDALVTNLERVRGERGERLLESVDRLGSRSAVGLKALVSEVRRFVDQ